MCIRDRSKEVKKLAFLKEADSTGNIVRVLGYPPEIAKVIQKIFGKNAFLIARWLKEYNTYSEKEDDNDWLDRLGKPGSWMRGIDGSVLNAYNGLKAAKEGPEKLREFLNNKGYSSETVTDDASVKMWADHLEEQVAEELKKDLMFYNTLGEKILSGEITNLAPYKKMKWIDAIRVYDQHQSFENKTPILSFEDGHRWINVGTKSRLIKEHLDNCGSVGVMSKDPDRAMIGLFNKNNQAVAVVTWSPNEKRISGDEGNRYSEVDEKYHNYILALVKHLGAQFDYDKSKSKSLSTKYLLRDVASDMKIIYTSFYDVYFEFKDHYGKSFYTNKYTVQDKESTDRVVNDLLNLTPDEQKQIHMPQGKDHNQLVSWTFSQAFDNYYNGRKPKRVRTQEFVKNYVE